MIAEILSVGTELLLGDILNTNAQYLSKRLADLGIFVYFQTVVGDNNERLKKAYDIAFKRADVVITTGGLGPTKDDLTKEIGAEYFGKNLILHEDLLEEIKGYFKKLNRDFVKSNEKQAYFPEGAVILPNENGTAPGCIIDEKGKMLIMLPGPPFEMIPMFENYVVPYIKKYIDGAIVSKVIRTFGIGESSMAEKVSDLIENMTNPTVAPYAKQNEAILRITARAKDEFEAKKLIEPIAEEIKNRLLDYVYGEDDDTLENVVGRMLLDKNITISTAESCTGGLLAAKLINYPGISKVFIEGAVTYSNEAKISRLKVKKETLQKYGAVSSQVAAEMALGIAKASNTRIGISTTGIAGPGGGSDEKPVGLVYIGLCIDGNVKTVRYNFSGDRQKIRERAAMYAIDYLRRELKNIF
ncbi:nicotinamide-nucleotide amidase [Caloramator quimbayensis]|uniref:Putative competence-damage inducible protein n=1 Tax=Caloramator quimbayensis TaxID=1147123 RepID=A0A1T4WVY8_9CLOT|nr:competence/damage-inducible protein A [Caloramator quimbayensis]SKA81530.1 nicotinamide-nucleotide amidase [Caloramator quimbayensis]